MKRLTVSFDDWVWEEIVSGAKNRSEYVQEAIIKLHYGVFQK